MPLPAIIPLLVYYNFRSYWPVPNACLYLDNFDSRVATLWMDSLSFICKLTVWRWSLPIWEKKIVNIFLMFRHQVAFILLFTSPFTVLNNHLCALDTTLRIHLTGYHYIHVFCVFFLEEIFSPSFNPGVDVS